jgi:hypothetical protein
MSTSFTDVFLPSKCYSKLVYMSPNEETWQDCASQRAHVVANIALFIGIVITLIVSYLWYRKTQLDPTIPYPVSIIIILGLFLLALYVFYPPYAKRHAAVEYEGYEEEKRVFLRNPNMTFSDYLRNKREEESTKSFSSLSRAQNIMAGSMLFDTISSLFSRR